MTRHALRFLRATATALVGLLLAGAALADQWMFVGARQQAMGGTGTAFASDSTANYWNPANLAFKKGWDVQIPATINGNIENRALEKLSDLIVQHDLLSANVDAIFNGIAPPGLSDAERAQVGSFLRSFASYGKQGESVHVGLTLGLSGRYDNFGFSALSLTTGTVFPNVDLANLGIAVAIANVVVGCAAPAQPCGAPATGPLVDQIRAVNPGLTPNEAGYLVSVAAQAGVDINDPTAQQILVGLADPATSFATNGSGALAAGISTQEFAFSYSHKLPMPFYKRSRGLTRQILGYFHNKTSIAVVPKYMLGVSFVKFFAYDGNDGASSIVKSLADLNSAKVSHNFGLDIGVSVRPTSWLHFGLMARNINSPKFDVTPFLDPSGFVITDITVEPQVRIGMALVPIRRLTLAFDFDLTNNEIVTLPGFQSRIVSMGAEYVVPFGRHVDLALRLGAYNNISGTVNQDWAMTGGFGLRLWSFVFDASAGGSFEQERIRTGSTSAQDFPTRLVLGVGFKWEKSI